MRSKLSVAGILLVLLVVNLMIAGKESALSQGRTIFLELAPVDPRSLMQGDYMVLRYALANQVPADMDSGIVYVTVDSRNVATSLSSASGADTVPLRFRRHEGQVLFDVESFFFQEGQGQLFQGARYAELRVDSKGMPILVGLLGPDLQPLQP